MPAHGTWTQTGSSGDGWKALAALGAVVLICSSGAAAALAGTVEAIAVTAAVVVGALILIGVPLLAWYVLRVRPAQDARAAEERAAAVAAYEEGKRRRALERREEAMAVEAARAAHIGLAVVAAISQQQVQSWSQAYPQPARVLRAEVER